MYLRYESQRCMHVSTTLKKYQLYEILTLKMLRVSKVGPLLGQYFQIAVSCVVHSLTYGITLTKPDDNHFSNNQ